MGRSGGSDPGAYKMVLVVRGELRLTAGKAAVQVAHAAVMLYQQAVQRDARDLKLWLQGGQKKIAVVAPDLATLLELQRRAKAAGLSTVLVEDAGFTEVAPGTKTVLGIGPAREIDVDPITHDLPLL